MSSPGDIFKPLTPDCTSDGINLSLWGGTLASEVFISSSDSNVVIVENYRAIAIKEKDL